MLVPSKPEVVEIPVAQTLPAECSKVWPLTLPSGTVAQALIEKQHEIILSYEAQVKACYHREK